PANHRYPSYYGLPEFRQAVSAWYEKRFNVEVNPDTEVLPLLGSKEGIAHIFVALVNEGDYVLYSDPGYPVYKTGAILSGGLTHPLPLTKENNYLADFKCINKEILRKSKLAMINYPNNPTSAVASKEYFNEVVKIAKDNNIVICHDNAYSELTYDGYRAPSFLEVDGAKETGVEFHSLSKTYNMTGWRIGFVVGNKNAIEALGRVKTNIDSGIFNAIQIAGIEALEGSQDCVNEMISIYKRRRDIVVETLKDIGLEVKPPKATIYVWVPVPDGHTSESFTKLLLDEAGVVVSPGSAYGESGRGYFRISLTVKDDRLKEALQRIKEIF
ncbi:MAG: LL-diaminopimelate aminotransferase, partial [Actinomycetia bacterium]|nr:LL-diaminopimelate aminotransferase [Actinomycetes bacterium]